MTEIKTWLKLLALRTMPNSYVELYRVINRHIYEQKKKAAMIKRNKKVIDLLLNSGEPVQLELGAGNRKMQGWMSIDLDESSDIYLDLSEPLPFPDNCITQIYSSHVLEHFYYPHPMINLLSECYRILKPGGFFKVAVPSARIYLEAYFNPEKFEADEYCRYKPAFQYNSKIDYVNYIAYMGGVHRYLFDEENLLIILYNAGFKCVKIRDFEHELDLEERKYESIYAEGRK